MPGSNRDSNGNSRGPDAREPRRRRWLRRALFAGGAVGVLALLFWVAVAAGFLMAPVVGLALSSFTPEGWEAEVGDVRGSWVSPVRLEDVRVRAPHGTVTVDSIFVRYDVGGLLDREVRVSDLRVYGPHAEVQEIPEADPDTAQQEASSWTVLVEDALVHGGYVSLPTGSGTFVVDSVHLAGRAALARGAPSVELRSLEARLQPPGGLPPGGVSVAGTLREGVVELQRLALFSPRSRLEGWGTLPVRMEWPPTGRADFTLRADPLDLRDLPLGWTEEPARVVLEARAQSSADSATLSVTVQGPGTTSAAVSAVAREAREGSDEPAVIVTVDAERVPLPPGAESPTTLGGIVRFTAERATLATPYELEATLRVDDLPVPEPERSSRGVVADEEDGDNGANGHGGENGAERQAPPAAPGLLDGPLTVEVEASGRSLRPDSAVFVAVARVAHAGARVSTAPVRLEVARDDPTDPLTWAATMSLDGSSARAHGRATLAAGEDDVRIFDVETLELADFDLSELIAGLPESRLSGSFSGHVRLDPSGRLRPEGDFEARLGSSRVASLDLDSARLSGEVVDGLFTGSVRVAFMDGAVETGIVAAPFDSVVTADLVDGRFEGLSSPDGTVRLSGVVEGSFRLPEAGPEARLAVRLDSSSVVRDVPLGSGSLDVTASGSAAEVVGRVQLGDSGFVDLSAIATGLDGRPTYRVRRAAFRDVPAALVSRGRIPRGSLTGGAELEASGATPEVLTGSGRLWLERSTISAGAIDSAWVGVEVDSGTVELAGGVRPAAGGRVVLAGHGSLGPDSTWLRAELEGSLPALGGFFDVEPSEAGVDSVRATLTATRSGGRWQALGGGLLMRSAAWQGVLVDSARLALRHDSSGFLLDTLAVSSTAFTLVGSGRVGPPGGTPRRLAISGELADLAPLSSLTEVDLPRVDGGELAVIAEGTVDSLAIDAELSARSISRAGYQVALMSFGGEGVARRTGPDGDYALRGSADLTLSRLSTPDANVTGIEVHVDGGPDSVLVVATAEVDRRRTGRLLATVDPRPDHRVVRVDTLAFQLDEDVWGLGAPATISYGSGVRVQDFALAAGDQRIEIAGGVDQEGSLDLEAVIDSTGIATVADLLGVPGLTGWVAGNLSVTGTTDAPRGHATLEAYVGPADERRGLITATLVSDGITLEVEAHVEDPAGTPLSLTGTGPPPSFALADTVVEEGRGETELDLEIRTDSFDIGWLGPFVDRRTATAVAGRMSTDLVVEGTPREPRLEGGFAIEGVRARLPTLGVTWTYGVVRARGEGSDLVIEQAGVTSGFGTADVTGRVGWAALEEAQLDLRVEFDDFQAVNTTAYQARISGGLDVGGTPLAPVVVGRVDVESMDFYLGETTTAVGLEDVTLTEADLRVLQERFGWVPEPEDAATSMSDRMTADVQVRLGPDSWVRKRSSPEMAVAFTGAVDVTMRPDREDIHAVGELTVTPDRGFVEQFGRRFELQEGTVQLDGAPESARLDLTASYTIPSHQNPDEAEVSILLSIEGTQEDLQLALASEPVLENADIVSYIATGRPASTPAAFDGADSEEGLVAAGADLALGQMVEIVEGAAAREIGLDVVEIRREGLRAATLVAGKYVTPRTYIGLAQPLSLRQGDGLSLGSEAQSEIEIEYAALRWLVLNVEASGADWRLFLRGRRAY